MELSFRDLEKTEKIVFLALMFEFCPYAFLFCLFWTMVDEKFLKEEYKKSQTSAGW